MPQTSVQFTAVSSSVSEGVGTTTLTLSIANPSATAATTVEVYISGGTGTNADINTYTPQTVTFPAGSSANQTLTITVTNDAVYEGASETVIFGLQNVAGGNNNAATIFGFNSHTLTITENDPIDCTTGVGAARINEFRYDTSNTNDPDEFIEIRIQDPQPDVSCLSQYRIKLLNGSQPTAPNNADVINTTSLAGATVTSSGGYSYYILNYSNLMQNGGAQPDGLALVTPTGFKQVLSYEGDLTVEADPDFGGMSSTDVGVSQGGADTQSIRVNAAGTTWTVGAATIGTANP